MGLQPLGFWQMDHIVINLNITGVLHLFIGHAEAPQVYVNSKLFSS